MKKNRNVDQALLRLFFLRETETNTNGWTTQTALKNRNDFNNPFPWQLGFVRPWATTKKSRGLVLSLNIGQDQNVQGAF